MRLTQGYADIGGEFMRYFKIESMCAGFVDVLDGEWRDRADMVIWLAARCGVEPRLVVAAAADCLALVHDEFPKPSTILDALNATWRWAKDPTDENAADYWRALHGARLWAVEAANAACSLAMEAGLTGQIDPASLADRAASVIESLRNDAHDKAHVEGIAYPASIDMEEEVERRCAEIIRRHIPADVLREHVASAIGD
jgi:hypothetical protein